MKILGTISQLSQRQRIIFCLVSGYMALPFIGNFYTEFLPVDLYLFFYIVGGMMILVFFAMDLANESDKVEIGKIPRSKKQIQQDQRFAQLVLWYALFLWLAALFYPGILPIGSYALAFDQHRWNHHYSDPQMMNQLDPRQQMLGDVVDRFVINGHKADIVKHLGKPQAWDDDKTAISYHIGSARASGILSEFLVIWFDDQGNVTRYDIATR